MKHATIALALTACVAQPSPPATVVQWCPVDESSASPRWIDRDFADAKYGICGECDGLLLSAGDDTIAAIQTNGELAVLSYSELDLAIVRQFIGREAVVGILAHEVGHHLDFLDGARKPQSCTGDASMVCHLLELTADSYAGCSLARSGLSPEPLLSFLRIEASQESDSHPAWPDRKRAVMSGFERCR